MIIVRKTTHLMSPEIVGVYETTDAALQAIPASCIVEQDADYPECYDVFDTWSGDIFTIQPEGFQL